MSSPAASPYISRTLTIIAAILSIAALRAAYAVVMPTVFAGVIVAALWPLKAWLGRYVPSWLGTLGAILAFIAVLAGFAASVYLSIGQVVSVMVVRWPAIQATLDEVARWASGFGISLGGRSDQRRVIAAVQTLAMGVYGFTTYVGFIGLLVVLGLPEAASLRDRASRVAGETMRRILATGEDVSAQVRRYLGTTLLTSVITGVASAAWSYVTGLELALTWGLLNFLLNFVPVIGNIVGILPPTLYALVQFEDVGTPILVFVGFAVLQVTISNVVYPILQGRQLSLSPLAIVLSMAFWSWVWGIAGALIAVPLTAVAVLVFERFERTRWLAAILSASARGGEGERPR